MAEWTRDERNQRMWVRSDGVTVASNWHTDGDLGAVWIAAAEEYVDVADNVEGAKVWADRCLVLGGSDAWVDAKQ